MPKALPIRPKPNATSLSSSKINKVDLVATDVFFQCHRNLKGESRPGTFAVKLAREVYFGSKVMSKCTVSGCRDLPGLPTAELGELKHTLFLQFPQFWKNPVEFGPNAWRQSTSPARRSDKHNTISPARRSDKQYSAVFDIIHDITFCLLFFLSVIIVIILTIKICYHYKKTTVCSIKLYGFFSNQLQLH